MAGLELRVPPVVVGVVFALGIVLVSNLAPLLGVPLPARGVVATSVATAGVLLGLACVLQFRRARTTVNPMSPEKTTRVVCAGTYRWSRNPMYLAMALVLLGLAAWESTLTGYAMVFLFCLYLTRFQIEPEERALLASFGQEFTAYMARVRRWL